MIDLEKMSSKELIETKSQIDDLLEKRKSEESSDLLVEFRKKADELGIDFDELVGVKKKKKTGSKRTPKYRNPSNSTETWTGTGRQPNWVKTYLAEGKKIEDCAI